MQLGKDEDNDHNRNKIPHDGRSCVRDHFIEGEVFADVAALNWLDRILERRRSRMALLEMSDAQLKDIGISRADAYREGHIPLWN